MAIRPYLTYGASDQASDLRFEVVADAASHAHQDDIAHLLLDPAFPYGEHLLQFLWEKRLFDGRELRTADGRSIEVIDPGRIQSNSGPDLLDARIRIDGQLWSGTVEVHLRSTDWSRHGHQHDPAYNNVVLHVVHTYDGDVKTLNGQIPPSVALSGRIDKDRVLFHLDLMKNREWVPCAKQVHRVDPIRIGPWLDRVLVERLERKCSEVEELYHSLGKDRMETCYHMLLGGFGFKVNTEPFRMLASALPLRTLLKYRDDPIRLEALLFGQAGLLQTDHIDEHPRQLQAEHAILGQLHGLRPAPLAAWKMGRLRPANFPTVRIAQVAALIHKLDGQLTSLLDHDTSAPLLDMLDVVALEYWDTHFRFDEATPSSPKRLGRTSAERIIANVIVPFHFALSKLEGKQELADRALNILESLPAERNSITDRWASLGVANPNAARSQALIELKNSYCGQRRCLSCVIGATLLKDPQ